MSKRQIDTIVEGLSTLLLGVSLSDDGAGLRIVNSTRPGTEMARQSRHIIATEPLLRGLPRRNYLAAFGQEIHPETIRAVLPGVMDPIFAELKKEPHIDPALIEAIKRESMQLLEMIRSARGCFDHLDAGSDGRFAGTLILEVTDNKEWMEVAQKLGSRIGKLPVYEYEEDVEADEETDDEGAGREEPKEDEEAEPEPGDDAEALELLRDWARWKPQAEQIEGLAVSHSFVDMVSDSDLEVEEIEVIKTIFGREAMTARIVRIDAKTVVITVGGGADQMARVIRAVRGNRAPLHEHDEIARYAAQLPPRRAGEFHFAADRAVNFLHRITDEVGDGEPFPFWMPRVDAPLLLSVTGGDGWSRHDLFAPMPLLRGITEGIRLLDFSDFAAEEVDDDDQPPTENAE